MVADLASAAPRLAVIVPIFRHASLLIEAIESVLAQRLEGGLRLLLVNDGCPFQETDEVCATYAMAYPEIVTYLRKANGGLSDARDCGIRHVLAHLPSVEALYMLDADNRLHPDALARALAALDAAPEVDWIYPNIDMFGLEKQWDYGGDYSLLIHSGMNICEAGSLIRRRVFEAGVLFDTGFKMGWEDWDFFLSAAQSGFRGKNIEDFGFLYRKRPESMLADSERDRGALQGAMQQKHKPLYTPRSLVALEHAEAPRYAIHIADRGEIICCVDPDAPGIHRIGFAEFEQNYWNAQISPGRDRTPPFNIVLSSTVLDGLREARLLHWVLWKLETICETGAIAALSVQTGARDRLSVSVTSHTDKPGQHSKAVAVAVPTRLFSDVIRDPQSDWIDSLARRNPDPPVTTLEVQLPQAASILTKLKRPSAIFDTLSLVHRMRASQWAAAADHRWTHRVAGVHLRGREHTLPRRAFDGAPLLPRVPDGRRHIGFLLPLVEFGGVEKVAQQMARGLRAHGWVPHAFVLGCDDIALTPDWSETFETTNLLADAGFSAWGGGARDYLGTNVPKWAESGRHGVVLGLLHWLDAAINFHGGAAVGLMGQLRRMGVKTLNSLHLNDLTPLGRPVGNTYLGVAYEHAFDYFVPCSHQLGDWLNGLGVPQDKIVPVQNAPGFEIDPDITARRIAARRMRSESEPLRVLYLGRLDRQKGLDRLAEVIRLSKAERLNVTWRVLGKAVIAEDAPALPPEVAAVLEPPVSRPRDLAAAYAWADVVVLLSRYEGLPLTVLEAMRAGAVVIATDVGATGEVLRDGETGVLVPQDNAVDECMAALRRFSQNRPDLAPLAERAVAAGAVRDWTAATADLAAIITPQEKPRVQSVGT
ncbi:glycosyltransferase [Roseibacterium beibuensis]|uniref:Glycosyltransferase n=1 Tax=[Roseibacterium] beibuensis TaxID=1193142 RepID=A0ABP9L7S4_9RHOB|nr:glycosyltransferase [Roseibacterium beibuensis]MCS6623936.1 glycosyltransferase [Roseibacterium beibuensis]